MSAIAPEQITSAWPEHIVLEGISWDLYNRLVDEAELGRRHAYMTYDHGRLEIMSPSPPHEGWKKIIGGFVELLAMELRIPFRSLGNVTIRRRELAQGLEPDECYYFKKEATLRDLTQLSAQHVPAPDLVIEMEVTHRSIGKHPIYARIGVPEIWVFDGLSIQGLELKPDSSYQPIEHSLAFPFLRIADLEPFIRMVPELGEMEARCAFRDWVRQFAKP